MNRFQTVLFQAALSPTLRFCCSGFVAAICLVAILAPLRLLMGFSNAVDSGLLIATCAVWWLVLGRKSALLSRPDFSQFGLLIAALGALLSPFILGIALHSLSQVSLLSLQHRWLQYSTVLLVCAFGIAPCGLGIALAFDHERRISRRAEWNWLISFGISSVLIASCLLPALGARWLGLVALLGSLAFLAASRWFWNAASAPAPKTLSATSTAMAGHAGWVGILTSFLTGGALALACSVASQLILRNFVTDLALLAGILTSYGVAQWGWSSARSHSRRATFAGSLLLLSVWIGAITAGYPLWCWLSLQLNARGSSLVLLILLRVMLLIAVVSPAGTLLQRLGAEPSRVRLPLLPALCGLLIYPWLNWSVEFAAVMTSSTALIVAVGIWLMDGSPVPRSMLKKVVVAGFGCAAVLGLIFVRQMDRAQSEKILFSSQTLQMARQGTSMAKLQWSDEGRHVVAFENLLERWSLWKHRGSQLALKKNGLSTGMHSTRPGVCPNSAADTLPALLPLTLHPGPQDVLLLDVHPAALQTCQAYPLRLVRTLESGAVGQSLLNWLSINDQNWNLTGGPEFQFGQIDPLLAMYSGHECTYDVIVCPLTHPATSGAASYTSQEFYRQVKSHLNEEGLFAQRIPYYDLSPKVVKTLTATLQSVFGDLVVFESIPGELIFVCAKDKLPKVDEELITRMKAPQCRRLLSESGWDWSMLLGRGSLTSVELQKFMPESGHLNCRADASDVASLSLEVSRWGAKGDYTRDVLAQTGTTLRTLLTSETTSMEVTQRLEDLNLAHTLQKDHPNDPWGYRGALKNRLKERPRSELVQVKYEGLKRVLDEEDRRRKEYLKALGEVVKERNPTPEMIRELTGYEAPFDPLVSLFVHYEAIQLMDRCQNPDSSLKLANLLRTVYFANGYDQSVRNVSSALELICSEQSPAMSSQERWDEVNSLLQLLSYRWQMRLQSGRTSRYDSVDTENCTKAVNRAMTLLASSAGECGVSAQDWESRKANLEQSLVRPLRQHRSSQLKLVTLAPQPAPAHPPVDVESVSDSAIMTDVPE